MWTYEIRTGRVFRDGSLIPTGIGWAGQGEGKNNPAMQNVPNIGPLPCGLYKILAPHDNPRTGPYTMDLVPDPKNEMYGRKLFRIHGAAFKDPQLSSEGCIVQVKTVRVEIWEGSPLDHDLQVVVDYPRPA